MENGNNLYHIVADGFSRIRIRDHNPELFGISDKDKKYLESFVEEQTRKAKERGGVFYDGSLIGILMDSFMIKDGELSFDAQNINYSQHAGLFRKSFNAPLQAMYVNGLTITQDNKLVFGTTQATEADWMGKLNLPAGGLKIGPDGFPSLGAQFYEEIIEELGITPDYHIKNKEIIPGWINGMSKREGNYHLTTSFITYLLSNEKELSQYFGDWKEAQIKWMMNARERGEKVGITEFKELRFLPNDQKYLLKFIEEQDAKGKSANMLGKSLDVIEEWVRTYNCDIEKLKSSKDNTEIYLPQPKF